MVTPLTADGAIDSTTIASLADFLIAGGVAGLFVLGTSGESPYLTNAQRQEVIAATHHAAAGRVPVLAGVIDTGLSRVVDQAHRARDAGADFLVVTAPFYASMSVSEVELHFRAIHDQSDVPIIAYHIPTRTHAGLDMDMIKRLAEDGVLAGIKDSSADVIHLRRLLDSTELLPGFTVMTGSELLVDVALFCGAHGAVPGLANVDPHGFTRMFRNAAASDWESARIEQRRLARLFSIIRIGRDHGLGPDAAAYGGFKAALMLRGIIPHCRTADPQTAFPDAAVALIKEELAHAELL